jgi:hypothetical protein
MRHDKPEAHINNPGKFQRAVSNYAFFKLLAHPLFTG